MPLTISVDIIKGKVPLTKAQKEALQRYKKDLWLLATRKAPLEEKKKVLKRKGFFLNSPPKQSCLKKRNLQWSRRWSISPEDLVTKRKKEPKFAEYTIKLKLHRSPYHPY